jgi:hypothetical protein
MLRRTRGLLLAVALGLGGGCGDGNASLAGTGGSEGEGGAGGATRFEPGPTCIAFCAKAVAECDALSGIEGYADVDEESCQQGCESSLAIEGAKSDACGDAVEAVFACVAELDCKGVNDWARKMPPDAYPCLAEVATVGAVCP